MTDVFSVRPKPQTENLWQCYNNITGEVVLDGVWHSEAWREADKRNGEAKSRSESTSDWAWRKNLDKPA